MAEQTAGVPARQEVLARTRAAALWRKVGELPRAVDVENVVRMIGADCWQSGPNKIAFLKLVDDRAPHWRAVDEKIRRAKNVETILGTRQSNIGTIRSLTRH